MKRNGHDVPADEIRKRYIALPLAIGAADRAQVIDNSRPVEDGPETVLSAEAGRITVLVAHPPSWLGEVFSIWGAPLRMGNPCAP